MTMMPTMSAAMRDLDDAALLLGPGGAVAGEEAHLHPVGVPGVDAERRAVGVEGHPGGRWAAGAVPERAVRDGARKIVDGHEHQPYAVCRLAP